MKEGCYLTGGSVSPGRLSDLRAREHERGGFCSFAVEGALSPGKRPLDFFFNSFIMFIRRE